ncbi:MAG: hypothetical protein D3923_15685, partial [Candidatus Electrothrix sp. AR3]|nr:hypothetical protein [Candidatus Electrothrix sp. AR3]
LPISVSRELRDPDELGEEEIGPLYTFGQELTAALSGSGSSLQRGKLTIIGHSMGTILAAEFLRLFPEAHFDRIVFMAAACPVRALSDSIFSPTWPTRKIVTACSII